MQASFFSEDVILIIFGVVVVGFFVCVVYPLSVISSRKTKKKQDECVDKLAEAFGGQVVEIKQNDVLNQEISQKTVVFSRNGCKYLINPFSFLLASRDGGKIGYDTKTFSSIYVEAIFDKDIEFQFEATYHEHKINITRENKFDEKYVSISNEDVFEIIVGHDNFVNFVKYIDFKFSPDLVLKLKDNKLQLYFAKMGCDIDKWKEYMDFFDNIINKINKLI